MAPPVNRTKKQRELMSYVIEAARAGTFLTQEELHAKVSYVCTFGAIRVSVRFLEQGGIVKREKSPRGTLVVPTKEGFAWFDR